MSSSWFVSSSSSPGLSSSFSALNPLVVLAKELEAHGLEAVIDRSISVVDARPTTDPAGGSGVRASDPHGTQRIILRADPVTAHPWWWLLWPGERFKAETTEPEVVRLLPVEETADVARRVRNILILESTE